MACTSMIFLDFHALRIDALVLRQAQIAVEHKRLEAGHVRRSREKDTGILPSFDQPHILKLCERFPQRATSD